MILEQQLEANIIAAFKAAHGSGVYYSGAWQAVDAGAVKGSETDEDTVCTVTLSPRAMSEYDGGVDFVAADFAVEVAVVVRGEMDATGSRVLEAWSKLAPVVWSWVKGTNAGTENALAVTDNGADIFSPGGVQQTGGTPPTWNDRVAGWGFTIGFTIKGIINE